MSALKVGALFAGYGGIELALGSVLDTEPAWFSEFDKAPSAILAHHWPDVPNLGDVTKIDWAAVEPVDIITGGSPCQDLSHAGKRAGMKAGTRSGLWASMCDAIDIIRPRLVVWENVRGAYSAAAEGGPHDHELCLCGWTDRRGGMRSSGHAEGDVPSQSVDRDDRTGAAAAEGTARTVRGDAPATPEGDRPLGGGVDARAHRRAGGGAVEGGPSTPSPEGRASRLGPGSGGGAGFAGDVVAGSVVDAGSASAVSALEGPDARTEPQGSSCECPECGGCVDAPNCQMEPCPGCMGGPRDGESSLRALGRVLGDLAELGYDASWYGLRAADVGAAHGRFRVFLFATPGNADGSHVEGLWPSRVEESRLAAGPRERRGAGADAADALTLLPTPAVNDMGTAYTPEEWDAWTDRMKAEHGNGNGHGKSLNIEALRLMPTPTVDDAGNITRDSGSFQSLTRTVGQLLPTPRATDGTKGGPNQRGSSGDLMLPSAVQKMLPTPVVTDAAGSARHTTTTGVAHPGTSLTDAIRQDWREYEAAIRRQEAAFGRPAPLPTEPGAKGQPRLSPKFVEWLMALPAGWVTDVPGISRNDMLKALGNGVTPPQCAAALRAFLTDTAQERAS